MDKWDRYIGKFWRAIDNSYTETSLFNKFIGLCTDIGGMVTISSRNNEVGLEWWSIVRINSFERYFPTEEEIDFAINNIDEYSVTESTRIIMLKFLNEYKDSLNKEEEGDKLATTKYSIVNEKNEEIIKEMISKVDLKRFKKLLAIAGSNSYNKKMPNKDVVNEYLKDWAVAKYDFYVMMGNNLSVTEEVEVDINEPLMANMISSLCMKHPRYATLMMNFQTDEVLRDSIRYTDRHVIRLIASNLYVKSNKVSDIIRHIVKNKDFIKDFDDIMKSKVVKSNVTISIDPYDYIMCRDGDLDGFIHGIDGYVSSGIGRMLDECTLVGFACGNEITTQKKYGFAVDGAFKSWVQFIHLDKNTCCTIFSKQFTSKNESISKCVRQMLEKIMSDKLGIINKWRITRNSYGGKINYATTIYRDAVRDEHVSIAHSESVDIDKDAVFDIGVDAKCVYCGKTMNDVGSYTERVICQECFDSQNEKSEKRD